MKLLLDTHVFLWLASSPERLSPRALEACENRDNELVMSIVSPWEITIKRQLGKLELGAELDELIRTQRRDNELSILDIELKHVLALEALPDHHRDPFDRLLIAQSRVEHLRLVTADRTIKRYPLETLW